MAGQLCIVGGYETSVERPSPGRPAELPTELEAHLLQVTACKTPVETEQFAATAPGRVPEQKNKGKDKGKAVQRSRDRNLQEGIKESTSIISRPHPLSNGHLSHILANGAQRKSSPSRASIQNEAATKTPLLKLAEGSRIDNFRPLDPLQSTQPKILPFKQKKIHPSTAQRIISRLLPFLQLENDLWVRFDVSMDPGLKKRWPSNLNGFRLTFLNEGLEHKYVADLVMAARTNEPGKMEPTVMFTCERDYLDRIKKIVKDSPYIDEGCKLCFVEATPKKYSAGAGLSTNSGDWMSLSVEALLSNTGHMCGVKARALTGANLYTETFTAGGLVLINDCCYALTTGHSLLETNLTTTMQSDGMCLSMLLWKTYIANIAIQGLNIKRWVMFIIATFLHDPLKTSYWMRVTSPLIGRLLKFQEVSGQRTE